MTFIDAMEDLAIRIEALGYGVKIPQREEKAIDWGNPDLHDVGNLKQKFIDDHLAKIRGSDAVLLANFEKHGIAGYVGPNTLMEAAFGYALGKPVALLFDPGNQPCSIELMGITRLLLDGTVENLSALDAARTSK